MTCRLPRRWLPTNEKVQYNLSYWQSLLIKLVLSKPRRSVTTCGVEHVHLQQMESWMLSLLLLDHFCMWNWAHLARRTDRPRPSAPMQCAAINALRNPPLSPFSPHSDTLHHQIEWNRRRRRWWSDGIRRYPTLSTLPILLRPREVIKARFCLGGCFSWLVNWHEN